MRRLIIIASVGNVWSSSFLWCRVGRFAQSLLCQPTTSDLDSERESEAEEAKTIEPIVPSESFWWDRTTEVLPKYMFPYDDTDTDSKLTTLGEVLGRTMYSVVFAIPSFGNKWVIKYEVFCNGDDGMDNSFPDPIARESHFLKIVNAHLPKSAPVYLFSSEAIPVPNYVEVGKLYMDMSECPPDHPPMVRYMVSEKLGKTLYWVIQHNTRIPFETAAALTLQLVRGIQELHDLGIAHGDIHLGNVAVRMNSGNRSLALIDFGKASTPSLATKPEGPPEGGVWCHGYFSVWESTFGDSSFRDDIFRSILTMAYMVHGHRYCELQESMCNHHAREDQFLAYLELKKSSNFFDIRLSVPLPEMQTAYFDYTLDTAILAREHRERIRELCQELLKEARAPATPLDKPNYIRIQHILIAMITLVRGPMQDPAFVEFG